MRSKLGVGAPTTGDPWLENGFALLSGLILARRAAVWRYRERRDLRIADSMPSMGRFAPRLRVRCAS
jgi:hypothetical protein